VSEDDQIDTRLQELAEDLAAKSHRSVDEAVAALRSALNAQVPPISLVRRSPWYLRRWMPVRWWQRWLYRQLSGQGRDE
jgi:hypothetical protein